MAMRMESPAFDATGEIPTEYTCEGEDVSPELRFIDVPAEAKSLALIVDDPDAPDPEKPERTWVHWVLYNLPPDAGSLTRGVEPTKLPDGTRQGLNDWNRTGWGGPCPPIGRHRYFHKLYALDTVLSNLGKATKQDLLAAMQGHVVAQAELMGTYAKKKPD
jgi:Raf kinase inhibitor-like YbhB/YbcL family protein